MKTHVRQMQYACRMCGAAKHHVRSFKMILDEFVA